MLRICNLQHIFPIYLTMRASLTMIIISAILIIKRLITIYITIFNIYFQYVFNLVNNQQNKITKIEIYIILLEVQGPMGPSFYLLQRALGGPSLGGPIDPHLASEVRTNMAKKLFLNAIFDQLQKRQTKSKTCCGKIFTHRFLKWCKPIYIGKWLRNLKWGQKMKKRSTVVF